MAEPAFAMTAVFSVSEATGPEITTRPFIVMIFRLRASAERELSELMAERTSCVEADSAESDAFAVASALESCALWPM